LTSWFVGWLLNALNKRTRMTITGRSCNLRCCCN